MSLTLNERLVGVRAGMNGIHRRVNSDLDTLMKLEPAMRQDANTIALFRTCIKSIRMTVEELQSKQEEE